MNFSESHPDVHVLAGRQIAHELERRRGYTLGAALNILRSLIGRHMRKPALVASEASLHAAIQTSRVLERKILLECKNRRIRERIRCLPAACNLLKRAAVNASSSIGWNPRLAEE